VRNRLRSDARRESKAQPRALKLDKGSRVRVISFSEAGVTGKVMGSHKPRWRTIKVDQEFVGLLGRRTIVLPVTRLEPEAN